MHILKLIIFSVFVFGVAEVRQTHAQQAANQSDQVNGTIVYQQKVNMLYPYVQSDTLHFNRSKSIFHWNLNAITPRPLSEKAKNAEEGGNITMQPAIYHGQRVNLYDTEKDSLYSLMGMPNINKLLYLKENIPKIDWNIADSAKQIGTYTVQKATVRFRGRDYTAWFTPKIPIPFGPWKLHGLPGLILQAYDKSGHIYFSTTNITLNDVGSIRPIQLNGEEEVITLVEYKKIIDNFDNYQKQNLLKMVRPYLSKEELSKMTFEVRPVKHMEIFE